MCSHDPFFRTNIESLIWRQNGHEKFVGAFHLSKRVSDENRTCSISIRFFKITDPFDGRSFLMCSHDPFLGTNKNRILKNGSCERAFRFLKISFFPPEQISLDLFSFTHFWDTVRCTLCGNLYVKSVHY